MVEVTGYQPKRIWSSIVIAAIIVMASVAHGYSGDRGPFGGLAGTWSGPGTVTLADGAKENIRCRAGYDIGGSGSSLTLELRCSSDSFRFELESSVAHANGAVAGHWNERSHRLGGTVSGTIDGDRLEAIVEGPLSAMLEISTRGGRQTVSIQSPGSKITEVTIQLSRGIRQAALQ
jgi:hypothetical protein